MKVLNCANCGANLEYSIGAPVSVCGYCDSVNIFDVTNATNNAPEQGSDFVAGSAEQPNVTPHVMIIDEKFIANYKESSSNSQGGHLLISKDEIFFRPHAINFGDLSDKYMKIADVVKIEKVTKMFGISREIHFTDKHGRVMEIINWSRDKVISEVEKRKEALTGL